MSVRLGHAAGARRRSAPPAAPARRAYRPPPVWLGRTGRLLRRSVSVLVVTLIFAFIAGPMVVTVLSSLTPTDYLTFPPQGLSLRWFGAILAEPQWVNAFRTTFTITLIAVPISVVLGTLAAYAIGRWEFRGREALSALFLSPLMLPETMLGTALLYYFAGIGLINSLWALVIAHVLAGLPFVIRLVLVSVYNLDRSLESAAAVLGASPLRVFSTVTVPLIRPGLFAAALFAFVLSVGELALTLFVSGPNTVTVPVLVYSRVVHGFDPTITAVSAVLVLAAFPFLVLLDRLVGLEKVF